MLHNFISSHSLFWAENVLVSTSHRVTCGYTFFARTVVIASKYTFCMWIPNFCILTSFFYLRHWEFSWKFLRKSFRSSINVSGNYISISGRPTLYWTYDTVKSMKCTCKVVCTVQWRNMQLVCIYSTCRLYEYVYYTMIHTPVYYGWMQHC